MSENYIFSGYKSSNITSSQIGSDIRRFFPVLNRPQGGSQTSTDIRNFFPVLYKPAPTHSKYICKGCNQVFIGIVAFNNHSKQCEKETCTICKKTFFSAQTFRKHFRNCPPKRYPCPLCAKTYSRQSDVEKHTRSHEAVREQNKCHVCGMIFLCVSGLRAHAEKYHL